MFVFVLCVPHVVIVFACVYFPLRSLCVLCCLVVIFVAVFRVCVFFLCASFCCCLRVFDSPCVLRVCVA